VDEAVKRKDVTPGRYLVLSLDLSYVLVEQGNIDTTRRTLIESLNMSLTGFVRRYSQYLDLGSVDLNLSGNNPAGSFVRLIQRVDEELSYIHDNRHDNHDNPLLNVQGVRLPKHVVCYLSNSLQICVLIDEHDAFASEYYMNPHDTSNLTGDAAADVLKSFLAAVKHGYTYQYGVRKVFMTGVTPLLLSDYMGGGFNIAKNVSYLPGLSGLCGLTHSEVSEALEVICNDKEKCSKHLNELAYHANGYLFSTDKDTQPVFNTQTTIDYLNVIPQGRGTLLPMLIIRNLGNPQPAIVRHPLSGEFGILGKSLESLHAHSSGR